MRRLKCSHEFFREQIRAQGCYGEGTLQFMDKILHSSGVGGEAYMPTGGPQQRLPLLQSICPKSTRNELESSAEPSTSLGCQCLAVLDGIWLQKTGPPPGLLYDELQLYLNKPSQTHRLLHSIASEDVGQFCE